MNGEQLVCSNNLSKTHLWPQSVGSLLLYLDIYRWPSLVLCLQIFRLFLPSLVCHLAVVFWYTQCVLVFGFTTKLSFKFYIKHFELFESETGLELKYSEALLRMHPINLSSYCSNDHLYGDKMRLISVRKVVSSPFIFYQMSASLVSILTIFFLYTNALPTCQFIWFFVIELFNFYFSMLQFVYPFTPLTRAV